MGFLAISEIIPPAAVLPYAGASAPEGWLICDGRAVNRTTYAALFAAIGTSHGSGDGSTTFNLPDYRWTFLRGRGADISVTGSGTASNNQATFTAHGFNRTGVKIKLSSGTLSGLSSSTAYGTVNYWVIVVDENTLAFATSKANALSNTRVTITGVNSAVIIQYEDPDASVRASNANGANSGASVGSHQEHQYGRHTHRVCNASNSGAAIGMFGVGGNWYGPDDGVYRGTTAFNGAEETRPSNISVNYIIKF
jgi:microcystin-dependent protein